MEPDEGEWGEEPEQIESRPSGMQVISARLPSALAEELLAAAAHRKVRPSQVVREAVEKWLHAGPAGILGIQASVGGDMRVLSPLPQGGTENANLVAEIVTEPFRIEVLSR